MVLTILEERVIKLTLPVLFSSTRGQTRTEYTCTRVKSATGNGESAKAAPANPELIPGRGAKACAASRRRAPGHGQADIVRGSRPQSLFGIGDSGGRDRD